MIILDTNVVSELIRLNPNSIVLNWVNSKPIDELGITAITVSEILYGIGKLPVGRRKQILFSKAESMFEEDFNERIFPFDELAAVEYSILVLRREKLGLPISMADALIASISISENYSLATRNIKDFKNTGVWLINPWNN